MLFASIACDAVFLLDAFPIRAGVLIVIHLAMFWWIFR